MSMVSYGNSSQLKNNSRNLTKEEYDFVNKCIKLEKENEYLIQKYIKLSDNASYLVDEKNKLDALASVNNEFIVKDDEVEFYLRSAHALFGGAMVRRIINESNKGETDEDRSRVPNILKFLASEIFRGTLEDKYNSYIATIPKTTRGVDDLVIITSQIMFAVNKYGFPAIKQLTGIISKAARNIGNKGEDDEAVKGEVSGQNVSTKKKKNFKSIKARNGRARGGSPEYYESENNYYRPYVMSGNNNIKYNKIDTEMDSEVFISKILS